MPETNIVNELYFNFKEWNIKNKTQYYITIFNVFCFACRVSKLWH